MKNLRAALGGFLAVLLYLFPVNTTAQNHLSFGTQPPGGNPGQVMSNFTVEVRDTANQLVNVAVPITIALATNYQERRSGAQLTFVSTDSEELIDEVAPGTNAFDGDLQTYWHTEWGASNPPPPHEIIFDVGSNTKLTQLTYQARQDGLDNGVFANYQVFISGDGSTWGSPVTSGTFTFTLAEQVASFTPTLGRFVRLVELSEVAGDPWGSAAEITVFITTTGGGTLTGTLTRTSSGGIATFSGVALSSAGTYVLQATSSGITTGQSQVFTIASAPPGVPLNLRAQPEPQ